MKTVFRSVLFVAALFLSVTSAQAACTGSSPKLTAPTWADVAACHTAASNGDVITVTAGSFTVTTTTTITKHVYIKCGGVCTLTDNVADVADLINITESSAGHTRLEGFTFVQGSGQHLNPNGVINLVHNASSGLGILIKGNSYASGTTGDFIIAGVNRGVIWGNSITATWLDVPGVRCSNNVAFVRHKNTGLTGVWFEGPYYGDDDTNGDKNLYIEGNTLDNAFEGVDVDANARTVIRYNTITNSGILNHGVDTGDTAGRYMEIYQNTFIWSTTAHCAGGAPASVSSVIYLRGAPALIHDNVIPNVTGAFWGDKSEITFTDEKLRRSSGTYGCWTGGYPSRHQVGWGYSTGGTQAGTTGEYQDLEPVYLWNNTGAGNYGSPSVVDYAPNECGGGAPSSSTYIVASREYYTGTAKPGYAVYDYPHPDAAQHLYVSTTGSDAGSNDCLALAAPCATFARAVSLAVAPATINICHAACATASSGNFNEGFSGTYAAVPAGTSFTSAITVRAYPGETITWIYSGGNSGTNIVQFISNAYPTMRSFYWIFKDIIFDAQDINSGGIGLLAASRIRFSNVEIKNALDNGIITVATFIEYLNMNVHDNGNCAGDHGIYMTDLSSDNLIDGGSWHDNYGYGIHIYGGSSDHHRNVIRNTKIYSNNHGTGGGCTTHTDGGAGGIVIGSGNDNVMYNSLIYDNLATGVDVGTSGGGLRTLIYNNTIYGNQGCMIVGPGTTNAVLKNNICYGNTSNNTINNLGAGTTSTNNLLGTNPLFTNEVSGIFTLLEGSPAIDTGVSLAAVFTTDKDGITRPQASGWDIGAYERVPGVGGPGSGNTRDAATVTENCTGAAGALTTGYTQISTAITVNRDGSGRCTGSAADAIVNSMVRSTGTFSNPQYSSGTVRSVGSSTTGASYPLVGCLLSADQDSLKDGYGLAAYVVATTTYTTLVSWSNGTGSALAQRTDTTWADGDEIAIECAPGHIYGFKNTSVVLDVVDSTHTTGKPGFGANGDALIDDIELGDLNGGASGCTINVTGPALAQAVTAGAAASISWLSSGCTGTFNLYYLVGGQQYLIASPAFDASPYSWTVNAPASASSQVRVTQGAVSDDSEVFTVLGTRVPFR